MIAILDEPMVLKNSVCSRLPTGGIVIIGIVDRRLSVPNI